MNWLIVASHVTLAGASNTAAPVVPPSAWVKGTVSSVPTGVKPITARLGGKSLTLPSAATTRFFLAGNETVTYGSGSHTRLHLAATMAEAYDPRLRPLTALRPGWDTYSADPPNDIALHYAGQVLALVPEQLAQIVRVSPSAEGGAAISFLRHGRYADIECFNSGEILAVVSDRKDYRTVWEVSHGEASLRAALLAIANWLA